jgi:fatty acid-binding protein DegV
VCGQRSGANTNSKMIIPVIKTSTLNSFVGVLLQHKACAQHSTKAVQSFGRPKTAKKSLKAWDEFIKQNPGRLKK